MDIQFLLALQHVRESLPSFIETILAGFSYIADGPGLVAILLVVYWCIHKRTGQLAFMSFAGAIFVSQFLKNIACVYRPWIRDAAIVPSPAAIDGATGYSFPSGHSTGATSSLGSIAWSQRKFHKAISVICIICVLIICFSRNFLGVHTPQDVLVGIAIGVIFIAVANALQNWIERYDAFMPGHKKDILVMVIALVLCVIVIAIVLVKPYPLDYVDGKLIVDPVDMQKGAFEGVGVLAGWSIGWVLERRLVAFSTDGLTMKDRGIRGIVGVICVGIVYLGGNVAFKAIMPYNWAKLCTMTIVAIFGIFVAPLVFSKIEARMKK